MSDVVRQEVIAGAHTVVIKVGTNVLARPDGTLDPARFAALAEQIQRVRPLEWTVARVPTLGYSFVAPRAREYGRPKDRANRVTIHLGQSTS